MQIKRAYLRKLLTIKIAVYQDQVKKSHKLFFLEQLNVQCDLEAKKLIYTAIKTKEVPLLPFQFHSPIVSNSHNNSLVLTEKMRVEKECP